jgi:hypothetical protein
MPNVEIPLLAWKYVNESVSSELSHTSHHCHHYKSTSVTPTESPISLTHSESANSISKWDEHLPLPIHDWEIPYSNIPLIPRDKSNQPNIQWEAPPTSWEAPLTSWEAPPTNAL